MLGTATSERSVKHESNGNPAHPALCGLIMRPFVVAILAFRNGEFRGLVVCGFVEREYESH